LYLVLGTGDETKAPLGTGNLLMEKVPLPEQDGNPTEIGTLGAHLGAGPGSDFCVPWGSRVATAAASFLAGNAIW
jgi:hypothetical protein